MPTKADQLPKDAGAIWRAINKIRKQVAQMAGAQTLQSASIIGGQLLVTDSGKFAVIDSSGSAIFDVGNLAAGGTTSQMGLLIGRVEDGTTVLATYNYLGGEGGTTQTLNWFDHAGNIVLQDDQAGVGLGRPYLGTGGWYDATGQEKTPMVPSSAHSWTTVMQQPFLIQHPRIRVYTLALAAASTSGQIRILDGNGNQVGNTLAISAGGYGVAAIEGALSQPYSVGGEAYLSLQINVTSGTGSISAAALSTWGLGSQL